MVEIKEQLMVQPLADYSKPIGAALWRMEDSRARTLHAINHLSEAEIDWQAAGLRNTIGTLLFHIAASEIAWLYEEVYNENGKRK